jgi:hypothetical protein
MTTHLSLTPGFSRVHPSESDLNRLSGFSWRGP